MWDWLVIINFVCFWLIYMIICSSHRYRWAFVPEVDVNRYSGPENTLIEGEQECIPHIVRVLEGIQQRYGVRTVNVSPNSSVLNFLESNTHN